MWLSDVSVKRPVAALVLSMLLCVFGVVSFTKLAVREMPDIESPVVSVSTRYQGASATIIESQITSVLEDQLAGISGIDEITSVSRNGMSRITVTFELGYDLNTGVSDIRDAVARAQRSLPEEADDPQVFKNNGSGQASVYINLSSSEMDRTQLTDYIERVLLDRFSLISGVSSVDVSGGLYKVMYVRIKPELMAGRGVATSDISDALNKENLESPGGQVRNDSTVMSVRTARSYQSAEDFEYLVVKRASDGTPIYLKDVADVFIGAENENSTFKSDGIVNVSMGIVPQSDANPLEVAKRVHEEVDKVQQFLPKGTRLAIDYDSTVFIERSISEVYSTLFITGGLVILVLYIFIGQLRATLIPAVTVPVSLISAFMAAYYFGFSINLITLMALILSIGLVVDDAIVVVENIFHHIERGEKPLLAAYKGTLRELKQRGQAATLRIIGPNMDSAYYAQLQQLIKEYELEQEVIFLGKLNQREIVQQYQQANIGIFTSQQETFGLAPLEMMAAGLPLISTPVGILGERQATFDQLGVVFMQEGQEAMIAERISQIKITDTQAIQTYLRDQFAVENVIEHYQNLYREVLS